MKWLENIFTKSKLMITSSILGVLCFSFLSINALSPFFVGFIDYAIIAILTIALLLSYKAGAISAQKALSGAVLATVMHWYWQISVGVYGKGTSALIDSLELVLTIALTIIFLNHILLQIDHKGGKIVIFFSQIVLIIAILVQIAELVLQLVSKNNMYYDKIHSTGVLCIVTMITCVEAKIQKYKARRYKAMEAGKWTPEERQKSKKIFKF